MASQGAGKHHMEPLWTVKGEETFAELFKRSQVGECVNSVAHDLNNYLGAILSYSELVGMDDSISPEAQRMLREVDSAIQKSTRLLSTLTSIARQERPSAIVTDMATFVDRVVALRKYEFGVNRIKVETHIVGEPGVSVIDEPKLIRAVLAVLVNSVEHVIASPPSRVDITVERNADGVEIRFLDSGEPVPAEDRPFIFEPFFTTKGNGHIGLGLTQAQEAARYHKGDLTYEPERGFVFFIPRNTGLG